MNVISFPETFEAVANRIAKDARDHPERFRFIGQRILVPDCKGKTAAIYRWLRAGPPKTIHEMAYGLQISYPAVLAIINDLRVGGAKIISVRKKRLGRVYKMVGGPLTYERYKRQRGRGS